MNLICPKSWFGESQSKMSSLSCTGRPLSVTLESRLLRQARDSAIPGSGERKEPTRVALPSGAWAARACRRNESKFWFCNATMRTEENWCWIICLSDLGSPPTFVSSVAPVLVEVHLYLEGRNSLEGPLWRVKQTKVLLIAHVGCDHAPLPVLLHVDGLQGVAGGLVVSKHRVCGDQAEDTEAGQDYTDMHPELLALSLILLNMPHCLCNSTLDLILTQFLPDRGNFTNQSR